MLLFCSLHLYIQDLKIFSTLILFRDKLTLSSYYCLWFSGPPHSVKLTCQLPFTVWLLKFIYLHLRIFFSSVSHLFNILLSSVSTLHDTSHHHTDYFACVPLHYILSVWPLQIMHYLGQVVPTVTGLYRFSYDGALILGALILVGLLKYHHHKHFHLKWLRTTVVSTESIFHAKSG